MYKSTTLNPVQYYPTYVNPKPNITSEQFHLIQQSWQCIKDGQYDAFKEQTTFTDELGFWGLQFYETLFESNPELQPMFKDKLQQSQMLTKMVDTALGLLPGALDKMLDEEKTTIDPQLIPTLIELAERHVTYRVKASHYGVVGMTLMTTLEKTLGSAFDDDTKTAWVELWSLICTVMIPAHVQKAHELGMEI